MTDPRNVVFVCLHGAAKSVLAAADFQRLADQRGVAVRAHAVGLDPDPEVSAPVARALRADGVDVSGQRPRRVTAVDLAGAWRVVAFGCDLGDVAPPGLAVEQWADVPAVGEGLNAARAAIRTHLMSLLDTCERADG